MFYTSQVVVWDYFHQQYQWTCLPRAKIQGFDRFFPPGATAAAGARWCLRLHGTAETLATSHVGVCPGVAGVTWRQWKVGLPRIFFRQLVLGLCVIICLELCRVIFRSFELRCLFGWERFLFRYSSFNEFLTFAKRQLYDDTEPK